MGQTEVVKLSKGYWSTIDSEDHRLISNLSWYALIADGKIYAASGSLRASLGVTVLMHRLILNAVKGQLVDHKDGDGLNNQRKNLRIATPAQNNYNAIARAGRKLKGIRYDKRTSSWAAGITTPNKQVSYTGFPDEKSAAAAYDVLALSYFGEFARPNFNLEERPPLRSHIIRCAHGNILRPKAVSNTSCRGCMKEYFKDYDRLKRKKFDKNWAKLK